MTSLSPTDANQPLPAAQMQAGRAHRPMSAACLPSLAVERVGHHLDVGTLCAMAAVNRDFYLSLAPTVQRRRDLQRFGISPKLPQQLLRKTLARASVADLSLRRGYHHVVPIHLGDSVDLLSSVAHRWDWAGQKLGVTRNGFPGPCQIYVFDAVSGQALAYTQSPPRCLVKFGDSLTQAYCHHFIASEQGQMVTAGAGVIQLSTSAPAAATEQGMEAVGANGRSRGGQVILRAVDGGWHSIWLGTGKQGARLPIGNHATPVASFSPDGHALLVARQSATDDGMGIWQSFDALSAEHLVDSSSSSIFAPVWQHDGQKVSIIGVDGVQTLDLRARRATTMPFLRQIEAQTIYYSPNDEWMVFVGVDRGVSMINLHRPNARPKVLAEPAGSDQLTCDVWAFSPNSQLVAGVVRGHGPLVHAALKPAWLRVLRAHDAEVMMQVPLTSFHSFTLAWDAGSRKLAAGPKPLSGNNPVDMKLSVFDVNNGQCLAQIGQPQIIYDQLSWNMDGSMLAYVTRLGAVGVVNFLP